MFRIREVRPNFRFEGEREVKSFDVKLVHDYDYGEVIVTVKVADKPDDETVLNLALETAYEECQRLGSLPVPRVKIAPREEGVATPANPKEPAED